MIGHDRFVTVCVTVGAFLNVTALSAPTAHEPVNVAARIIFTFAAAGAASNVSGLPCGVASSAARTTSAIRSADSSVNCTASVLSLIHI